MSAIAGIYSRRGAPLSAEALRSMSSRLRDMGPDGERFVRLDTVAMLHRPLFTDRESRLDEQPLLMADGYILTFDGRVDNAPDVRRMLGWSAAGDQSEARVVVGVYRRWGVDGFARVVGDFAFALWDSGRQSLVLCCDALGRRPLYYACTPDFVFWCSRCQPILEAATLSEDLDEDYLADFLASRVPAGSPFKSIAAVQGGHIVLADSATVTARRYWSFDPTHRISCHSDQEYEDQFAEIFESAVASRLRAEGPVFCELSGGVDSSAIACVANRLVNERTVEAPSLETVSYVFSRSGSSDETSYISTVEEHLGKRGVRISEERCPILEPLPDSLVADVPSNRLAFLSRHDYLCQAMKKVGARVLLSGVGGDQLFWSQPAAGLPLADLLVEGRFAEFFRSCVTWARLQKLPLAKAFWLGVSRFVMPRRWATLLEADAPLGDWLNSSFVKRTGLRGRMLPMSDDVGFSMPSSATQYGYIRQTMRIFALEPCSSQGYVDVRYPYLDRRLAEFALAIPLEQKVRPRESRSIVRRSLRGVVPELILQRRTKAGPAEAFYRALEYTWPRLSPLLENPVLSTLGIVDRSAFIAALKRARYGLSTNQAQLLRTVSLELWLRHLEKRPCKWDTAPSGRRHRVLLSRRMSCRSS